MSNQEQIERLADIAKAIHCVERHMKELAFPKLPVAIRLSDRATEHLEHARMFAGDLLRLAVLKCDHRNPGFFNVGEHGGRFNDAITLFPTPLDFIKWAKQELRELFYHVCEANITEGSFLMMPEKVSTPEWGCYCLALRQHLKEADQCLGLWLGNIYDAEKARQAPPSNATEASPHLSYFQALEKQSEKVDNEAMFNAIMADLDGVLADFGDKVIAAYPARTVEQVLRKHLGLPLKHETLKP